MREPRRTNGQSGLELLASTLHRLRFEFWSFRSQFPSIYLPLARLKHRSEIRRIAAREGKAPDLDSSPPPVLPGTEIVIEGFPRSANTFAVAAFRQAQNRSVLIAHHQHASAQVIAGAKSQIPTLMLIRDPEGAVVSYVIQHPFLTLRQALRHYIRFYRSVLPHRFDIITATFDEVTTDLGKVISRVNSKYETSFAEFLHTAENVERCFEEIERHERTILESDDRFETITARPSQRRGQLKDERRTDLGEPRLSKARARAQNLYSILAQH